MTAVEFNPAADVELGEAITFTTQGGTLREAHLFGVRRTVERVVTVPNGSAQYQPRGLLAR